LAKLYTSGVTTGAVINLARGSLFREEVTGLPQGVIVQASGSGPQPIIDGSDIAPNASFQKTDGLNHVYQIAWTHNFGIDGGKTAHRAWENGTRMQRAADLASCDTMPGSFFAGPPSNGGPDTIYVHASDDSDVSANAKTYELTRRRWGVQLYQYPNQASVYSIHTRRNAYADGSLAVDGLVSDCLAEDGRIHNVFIRGVAENTIAWKIEPPPQYGGATMFVTYEDRNDISGVTYRGCQAIAETDALGTAGSTNPLVTLGFFAHTAGATGLGTAIYENCETSGVVQGFSIQNVTNVLYYNCASDNPLIAISSTPSDTLAVLGGSYHARYVNASLVRFSSDGPTPRKMVIRGTRFVSEGGYGTPLWIDRSQTQTEITRSTFLVLGASTFNYVEGSFLVTNNIFYGISFTTHWGSVLPNFVSDNNLYFETSGVPAAFQIGTTNYSGLVAWRAATGDDNNSVDADPQFTGSIVAGDTNVAATSPAWSLQAGADYLPEDLDTTLQSYRYTLESGHGL
jgi:hypothetical protein